jgi:Tol biopolymer transport system component
LPTPGASGKQIFTIEPNGTDLRQITHPDGTGVRQLTSGTGGLFSLHPTWSPDSSQLLFLRGTSDPNLTDIWSINVDGSQLYQVTHQPAGYGTGQALACLP